MARQLLVAALALASACRLDPAGRCDTRADCALGLDCLQGVCAACRGDSDCSPWQLCGGDGLCAAEDGRCDSDADCASWQSCDAGHLCALRADHCDAAENPICVAPETCDPAHHCTLPPGECVVDADCHAWMGGCTSGSCTFAAAAGADVLGWGTVDDGLPDRLAVARVTTPELAEVGFDAGSAGDGRAFLDPATGAILYRHVGDPGGDTLRRHHRDASVPHPLPATWLYPADPSEDDEVAIVPSACPVTWGRWLVQGTTGALLYGCPLGGGALWELHVVGGTSFAAVKAPLAWSSNGYLLALDVADVPRILDAAGVGGALAITGLPAGTILAQRTIDAVGFLVAVHRSDDGADELWRIADSARLATLVGTYPAPPPDPIAYPGLAWEVMDADGTLYGRAFPGSAEIVLKRSLAGGAVKIYDEQASAPILQLGLGSFLFTRP